MNTNTAAYDEAYAAALASLQAARPSAAPAFLAGVAALAACAYCDNAASSEQGDGEFLGQNERDDPYAAALVYLQLSA